jgi:hypothetical protein
MRQSSRVTVKAMRNLGFEVSAAALRQWRARGHIGPGPGYDEDEIAAYLIRRVTPRGVVC